LALSSSAISAYLLATPEDVMRRDKERMSALLLRIQQMGAEVRAGLAVTFISRRFGQM